MFTNSKFIVLMTILLVVNCQTMYDCTEDYY
jgi:hypothetical protein